VETEELKVRVHSIIHRIEKLQVYAIKNLRWYHFRLRKQMESLNEPREELMNILKSLAAK